MQTEMVHEKKYKIIRFHFQGENEVIQRGLTLEQAQAHCQDDSTRGDGWFDGYDEDDLYLYPLEST